MDQECISCLPYRPSSNVNPACITSRPAYFIQKANEFRANVWVEVDERRINAKSLLGVLSMAITSGTVVTPSAGGPRRRDSRQDSGQNAGKGHLLSRIGSIASIASRKTGRPAGKKSAGLPVNCRAERGVGGMTKQELKEKARSLPLVPGVYLMRR